MNWVTQQVPFPRFGLRLKERQTFEEFFEEVEKKVDSMIGESTINEYKAYKNLVKHKKRINHVFSELGAETCFRSRRPGVDKKAQVVAVVSCSAAPPKAPRRRPSKKGRTALMTLLLLRFILARRSLLNQARENARHLKVFRMSRFRQLRALLI
jgi:uncharacterized protein YktA (UPF0223 family)